MSRLDRVVENYEAKLRVRAAGRLPESAIRKQVEHYRVAATFQDWQLDQVRQVLCAEGVATIYFPMYHAFSRELDKLTRLDIPDRMRQREMAAKATKWAMRGLDRKVLLAIALDVYNLTPPVNPPD